MSIPYTAGSGRSVYCDVYGTPTSPSAGDDITVTKLSIGALGSVSVVTATNPLPVQHSNGTQTMPSGDAAARSIYVTLPAIATGGATPYQLVCAATTNATSVKGSAGTLYGITVNNVNAAVRYLKLYDKATAPTVGSDTPVMTIAIPAASVVNVPIPPVGMIFSNGIAFATTTEATVAGTTAISANESVINLLYK